MCPVKLSGFAERLAFARLLTHFRTGRCLSNTEIGAAVGRTQPWVTKWAKSATPPRDYEVHAPLAGFLGVDERWLIRGEGDAPELELWNRWRDEREATAPQATRPAKKATRTDAPDIDLRKVGARPEPKPPSVVKSDARRRRGA
jgi:hypothetical protein